MKIHHIGDYAERRRQEYPPLEDQLDALWKGGPHLEEMRGKILDIKRSYPTPPVSSLEVALTKEREIRNVGALKLRTLVSNYSEDEQKTWFKQEKEARTWLADNTQPTPMLSAIAASRGVPLTELVNKVMENVGLFETNSGAILGKQQALLDQLQQATTAADIEIIRWDD